MKKLIYCFWMAFVLLAIAACFHDDDRCPSCPDDPDMEGAEIAITIGNEYELSTRSAITSAEQIQHIEHMYAYVFSSGNEDDNKLDENSLTCIYEEKLPWEPVEKLTEEFRCRLKAELYDNPDKNYLLLVVAVDNNKDTYTFPKAEGMSSQDIHLGLAGQQNLKLDDLQLALRGNVSNMAYTEVFAGATVFQSRNQLINVELTRRVAGLLCYVTDIPASIDGYDIIGMQLRATGALKTAFSLAPDLGIEQETGIKDFQEEYATGEATGEGSNVIAEVDLEALGAEAGPDGQHLYIPSIVQEGVLQTLQNTALLGAYSLPVESTGLRLVLKGRKTETIGDETKVEVKFFEQEGSGNYGINNEAGESEYPLCSNHIYSLRMG